VQRARYMTLEIIAPTSDDANRQRASIGWLNMQPTLQERTTYIITNAVAAIWSQPLHLDQPASSPKIRGPL
jgi:hypothetical protein